MKIDRKQKLFLEKLVNTDSITGYDKMEAFLNEYLDAFVKPKFKALKLKDIAVTFVDKDFEQIINELGSGSVKSGSYELNWKEASDGRLLSITKERIALYKVDKSKVFKTSEILSLIETVSHEYRHFVQANVAVYNKRYNFSKDENKSYSQFIKNYSDRIADDIFAPQFKKINGYEVKALYDMASRIDNAEFKFAQNLIGDKEDFDFPLYLLQSNEIDARQFGLSCLKELLDCLHKVDVLGKDKFAADFGTFYNSEKERESMHQHEAKTFYLALEKLLDKINDKEFFVETSKVEQKDLEKNKIEYYFGNAPEYAQRLRIKQDILSDLLAIQFKNMNKKFKTDKKFKNAYASYCESVYRSFIQNGISYAFDAMDKFTEKGTYSKLLMELIKEKRPLCSDSFENFGAITKIGDSENIFKILLDRSQIRYVDTAIMSVDIELRPYYIKKLLPLIKNKVNEINKQNLNASYDEVDEMLHLISTIKYSSGLAYPAIEQYGDFDREREKICKEYADEKFSEAEIGLLVDCEYALELLGYEKVTQMRKGDAPMPSIYRFGHCQDRESYLLKGNAREEYVRKVYGEIELENRHDYYDTRDELEREKAPLTDMDSEIDHADDSPERIY